MEDQNVSAPQDTPITQDTTPVETPEQPLFHAKYRHETKPVYLKDITPENYQMGLNYPVLEGKYTKLGKEHEQLKSQLSEYEQLLQPIGGKDGLSRIANEKGLERFMRERNLEDPDSATVAYQEHLERLRVQAQNDVLLEPQRLQAKRDQEWLDFSEENSDLRFEDLEPETQDDWLKRGLSLQHAYDRQLARKEKQAKADLEKKVKDLEDVVKTKAQNAQNEQAAVESMATQGAEIDWDNITGEQLDSLPKDTIAKNLNKVLAAVKRLKI